MTRKNLPAMPNFQSTTYGNLGGADFSVDASLVSRRRSPMPLNMISDNGGNPVKRPGWRVLCSLEAPVHNIFYGELKGKDALIVHGGSKLYRVEDNRATLLKDGVSSSKGAGFFMRTGEVSKLFLLTGKEYLVYDGETVKNVSEIGYVPTLLISKNPSGGGQVLEYANLIQPKRTESFLGNATDTMYQLSARDLDGAPVSARKRNSSGGWDVMSEGVGFSVNRSTGQVSFTQAHTPIVAGQDNVEITYAKTVAGYAERISKCTIATVYGVGASNRVFLSGNPEYKAQDWYSGIYDPTYFADINYSIVGTQETAIMGYHKLGEYLAIIKEDNQQDTTIFTRSGELTNGQVMFRLNQGIAGIGAVSKGCFSVLGDEPLFLARSGIYAITSNLLSYERTTKNRSYFIDKKLTAEKGLEHSVSCEWNGYYLLCVNTRCYILDGRHKAIEQKGNTDYIYESYYWENIPAVCFLSSGGELYFGTADGKLCKLNSDIEGIKKYNDNNEPISAMWCTPNDNDGATQYFKTLTKKGCLVTLSPFDRSSGKIYFVVDGNPKGFVCEQYMDIFNWEDIDFERFSFSSNESPQEIYFNKKQKKYKRMQIVAENSELNEAFGIHEIIKTYFFGNYSRNRG